MNLFGFVGNDPLNRMDPLGLRDDGERYSDPRVDESRQRALAKDYKKCRLKGALDQQSPTLHGSLAFASELLFPEQDYGTDQNGNPIMGGTAPFVGGVPKQVGSYIIKCKDGLYYVGKGPLKRMFQSIARLIKRGEKPVEAVFESAHPPTNPRALMDEAQKIRDLGGVNGGKLLNEINSPGEKLLPPP